MFKAVNKKVLIMALVDPSGNPRPKRIIRLCKDLGFEVHIACFPTKGDLPVDYHYVIQRPSMELKIRLLRKAVVVLNRLFPFSFLESFLSELRWNHSKLRNQLGSCNFNLIIVEDLYLLPFALSIKGNAKVIMDAREFYPGELENNFLWRLIEKPMRIRNCKKYLPLCDAIMTVSPGLAEQYYRQFGVSSEVIRSIPYYKKESSVDSDSNRIKIVHHGIANRDRCLENMIDIFTKLDSRFEMHFYLSGNKRYQDYLKNYACQHKKIYFHDPVPFDQIIPTLKQYDIGLCYFVPTTFNLLHALPNKLFEYIQARLVVAIGPSPDMKALINQYNCGVVSEYFESFSMAKVLNGLTAVEIMEKKSASHKAAKELCFENEAKKIEEIFQRLCI